MTTPELFSETAQLATPLRILVVGAGPVGKAFHRALVQAGNDVRSWSRSHGPLWPEGTDQNAAEVVLLAVRDDAIEQAADYVVSHGAADARSVVLHCAGGRKPSAVFQNITGKVDGTGLFHPLRSFVHRAASDDNDLAGPTSVAELSGTVFAICGDAQAVSVGKKLCEGLSGIPLPLAEAQLSTYHAAAVLVAGHVATLIDTAIQLFSKLGLPKTVGQQALCALTDSVLRNIEEVGLPQALTGPIARGDASTVSEHLTSLGALSCQVAEVYRIVAESSLDIAYRKGAASHEALSAVGELLQSRVQPCRV